MDIVLAATILNKSSFSCWKSCFSKQRISSHKRKIGYVSWLVSTTTNTAFTYSYTVLCELYWDHRKKSQVSATNTCPLNCCDSPSTILLHIAFHSYNHSDNRNVAVIVVGSGEALWASCWRAIQVGSLEHSPPVHTWDFFFFHGLSTVNAIYLWCENYRKLGYALSFLPIWTKGRYVSASAMF